MPTTDTKLYVNMPGGVIAKLADGTSESFKYGDPVSASMFAEHVNVTTFADGRPRVAVESQELDAHRRVALAENGQINSSSSPVPGNYSDLDEDGAAQLMRNLARFPEQQVAILKHEILFGGNRQKVMDAAGASAQVAVAMQLAAIPEAAAVMGTAVGDSVAPLGDPDMGGFARDDDEAATRMQERHAAQLRRTPPPMSAGDDEPADQSAAIRVLQERLAAAESALAASNDRKNDGSSNGEPSSDATSWDDYSYDDLKSYITQHELPVAKNVSHEDMLAGIKNVDGHENPQTPPASKTS